MKIFRTCHRHMSRPKELCLYWGPVVAIGMSPCPSPADSGSCCRCCAWILRWNVAVLVTGRGLQRSRKPYPRCLSHYRFRQVYSVPNILWKWHEGQWISNCFNTNYDRGVGDLEPQMTFMPNGNEMSLWYTDKFRFRMRSLTEPSGCFLSCP